MADAGNAYHIQCFHSAIDILPHYWIAFHTHKQRHCSYGQGQLRAYEGNLHPGLMTNSGFDGYNNT